MSSYYEKFLATGEVKCIDDEIPFEIPQGWEWCRLCHVTEVARGGSPRPIKDYITESPSGINWIKIGDTEKGGKFIFSTKERIKPEGMSKSRFVHKGDFLLTNSMSFGRPYITQVEGCIHDGWLVISLIGGAYCQDFLYYLLSSNFAYAQFSSKVAGAVVQNLNSDKVANSLFPIPPKTEQKRIVQKIESILPKVHQYEELSNELASINIAIHSKLKKSILQEAIQGKLVPQIKEEGTAEELLVDIRTEKGRLVKEGKLKKSALNDSTIFKGDDNKYYERINGQVVEIKLPFEYPNSWVVLRLKDVCQLTDGEKRTGKGICLDAKYLRGKSSATIIEKGKFVYSGDNIILVDGENSGEVFTVPQDGYMGSTFKQLWLSSVMWRPYILAFILFYKEELRNSKRGAAIPHLNKELFYNLPIGIPPFAEQQRIAERIYELSQLLK
ncbi:MULTISPECIES: restriction endonuclease subunit S [Bacteroidaceae]|uniref:restriction endonuclease subunit S n=1 Tax=Bacteroidaceae TaxID=815 RepID=UPI001C3901DA|nr:restriction endonuclease subunit S [Phocaeicola vulgatus]MBV3822701.1 restriction endonuclease subunit S [Phocaeicola vulgatus]